MHSVKLPTLEEMESNRLLARFEEGFLVLSSFWTSSSVYDMNSQRVSMALFTPWKSGSPCPCGSGTTYRFCCKRCGPDAVFVKNTDGRTYSGALSCCKSFKRFDFENVRGTLLGDPRFACAEDNERRCFWNFLGNPHIVTPYGKLVFGTVELTRRFLKLETMSDERFEYLQKVFDELFQTTIGDASTRKEKIRWNKAT
jgi:hypothetical protein